MAVQNKSEPTVFALFRTKRLWTQKFGLGLSFSASLSAFPSPRLNPSALRVRDIAIFGMPSLNCFLLLGGTALAGAHDVKEAAEEDCLDVCGGFYIFYVYFLSTNFLLSALAR